jgi:hypothetical protein
MLANSRNEFDDEDHLINPQSLKTLTALMEALKAEAGRT